MDQWMEWARGPLFRFAFAMMLLGLLRLVALNVMGLVSLTRRARDRRIPTQTVIRDTARWLVCF